MQDRLKELFNKCASFADSVNVSKISIIKGTDPFLQELSLIKKPEKRVEFAKKSFKLIGEGSARAAFLIPVGRVLKVAKNEKGMAQNCLEAKPEMQRDCTNRIIMADPEGKWIIVKRAKKISEEKFEELTGFSFDDFTDSLFYKFNNESDSDKPDNYSDIIKSDLFRSIAQMMVELDNDLQLGDLYRISSWGESEGKPVIVDYGLDRDIYQEYYEDD